MLYIRNATIFTPFEVIENGAVLAEHGTIVAVGQVKDVKCPAGAELIDAAGLILALGFIDLQINGAFGDDFTADPATIWRVAEKLPRYGVTAFLPTIVTSPLEMVQTGQKSLMADSQRVFAARGHWASCRRAVPQSRRRKAHTIRSACGCPAWKL